MSMPMPPRVRRVFCGVAACLGAWATPAAAQVTRPTVGASLSWQSYSFDAATTLGIEKLGLASLYFSAATPLIDRLSLSVTGAWAKGAMSQAGGEQLDISGLTDTQVSLTYSANEFINLSGIFVAPTGKESQTLKESIVAGAMASDLFPFKVSNWGSGGGMGVNASLAHPAGPVGVGLSVGLIGGREFKPLGEGQFAYRPGTLVRIVGALDGTVGQASKASLQVTYHRYGSDQIDGANLFQSGDRLQALASLAFPVGGGTNGIAYGGVTHRQRSTLLESVIFAQDSPSQNLFVVGGGFRTPLGSRVLQPDAELRVLRRSDSAGQGFDLRVGTSLELRNGGSTLAPSARVHYGKLEVRPGDKGSFFGFELGLTARLRGAR